MLPGSRSACFAVGYFFLSGLEAVADQLENVHELRLLIGNTSNRETIEQIAEGYRRLEQVRDAAEALVREVAAGPGKSVIVSADRPGFVVNRTLFPLLAEAMRELEDGVGSAADIDLGARPGRGHPADRRARLRPGRRPAGGAAVNSRERFGLAMRHLPADRVPIDIGGTTLTGMRPGVARRLADVPRCTGVPQLMNGRTDEPILAWAGTDFRSVRAIVDLPSPLTRRPAEPPGPAVDCWGVRREQVDGEYQITGHPLKGATVEDLARFPWPEPRGDEGLVAAWLTDAERLAAEGRYVVVGEQPVFGILELGCWMGGYGDFLMRLGAGGDDGRADVQEREGWPHSQSGGRAH
mgnify:CR=1 FL=1